MPRVSLPSQLQSYSGGLSRTEVPGDTVAAVLDALDARWPGIRFRVIDEQGRIRRHMRIYVGQDRVLDIGRTLSEDEEVLLFGALSGG
ncbi:MAG TPA: MoaD/ThiS family protein [Caulobacter sp.]|nr:MoaD/ThiS family protein [Caulobacter sp.]